MTELSTFRALAPCVAALITTACGSVIDDRQSSNSAAGSGGASTASVASTATGTGGATSSSSGGGGNVGPCPSTAWSHVFANPYSTAFGQGVAVDAACNVYLLGNYYGTIDLGAGPLPNDIYGNLFLAKYDPAGQLLWSHTYGKASVLANFAIDPAGQLLISGGLTDDVDFGNGCVLSPKVSDQFVVKLDANTGASTFCSSFLAVDVTAGVFVTAASNAAGDTILAGWTGSEFSFGSGTIPKSNTSVSFVIAFDPQGKFRWWVPLTATGDTRVTSVTVSADGVVHASGSFVGTLDVGLASAGEHDMFITEINPEGQRGWTRGFGGAGDESPVIMARGRQGGFVIAGTTDGAIDLGAGLLPGKGSDDVFVARLDAAGNALGGKLFGDEGSQGLDGMAVDDGGNILLTGHYHGTIDFGGVPLPASTPGDESVYFAKLGPTGNHLWSRHVDDVGGYDHYSVALDGSSDALITGTLQHAKTIDLGSGPLTSYPSGPAIVLAKLPP